MKKIFVLLTVVLFISMYSHAQNDIVTLINKHFPRSTTIDTIRITGHFQSEYVIYLEQPLDHSDDSKGYFMQRIFLSHFDQNAPNLLVTEGYSARPRDYELSKILKGNQIQVEYRFFGESKPDNYDYAYLTNDQAMKDLHRIRTLFGKIYKNKWITTGISKGGTTCLIYKSKYPKDSDVAVTYVAPLPYNQMDERCNQAIRSNGTKKCRTKLTNFQLELLKRKEVLLPKVDSLAKADSITFRKVGIEGAFEYAVMEFTFSFWQWGHDCSRIKADLTDQEYFELLNEIVGFDFYSDATCAYFEPAFYQFMKENGYYGFIHEHLKDKINTIKKFDNRIFAPQDLDLSMDKDYLKYVRVWLQFNGHKIISIQGEYDPWGACGFVPPKELDALLMIKEAGSHFTRIASFSKKNQEIIYDKLEKWLNLEVFPLEKIQE